MRSIKFNLASYARTEKPFRHRMRMVDGPVPFDLDVTVKTAWLADNEHMARRRRRRRRRSQPPCVHRAHCQGRSLPA